MRQSSESNLFYDEHYEELIVLEEGTRVRLRLIRPEDRARLVNGFEKLSQKSRYRRFLSPKIQLSRREINDLINIDQWNHIAIGAEFADGERAGEGIGIARCVRLKGDERTAEPAVTVLDELQNKGLGRELLIRLTAAARERGITTFRAYLLSENTAVKRLIEQFGGCQVVSYDGPAFMVEIALDDTQVECDEANGANQPSQSLGASAPTEGSKSIHGKTIELQDNTIQVLTSLLKFVGQGAVSYSTQLVDQFQKRRK